MGRDESRDLNAMDILNQENQREVRKTIVPIFLFILVAVGATTLVSISEITASVSGQNAPWEEFYSVFGMIYAIVSGFLLVEVLNRFNKLSEVVEAELNAISDVRDFLIYVDIFIINKTIINFHI